jgi:hypothetical protein
VSLDGGARNSYARAHFQRASIAIGDRTAVKDDEFIKIFDFEYTASQWKRIECVIDAQPGNHDKENIRKNLELLARQFRVIPQIEANVPRRDNLTLANSVLKCCQHLKSLLSESNVVREGSFYTAFGSPAEYEAFINTIEELQGAAKLVAANNKPLSPKKRNYDPHRDKYLGALCDLWVKQIHGKPTTSYRKGGGGATGPFVNFLVGTAGPVLIQFTPDGANRFIKRWKKGMAV